VIKNMFFSVYRWVCSTFRKIWFRPLSWF